MMENPLLFIILVVVAGIGAAVLHELTHLAVARLGGREAWIEWRELNERHYYPVSGPDIVDRIVGIAPFALGTLAAAVWFISQMPISFEMLIGWGVYTLNGIPNDFRV